MKKILAVALLGILASHGIAYSASFGPKHDKVVKIFQSGQEPTAKDAVWTQKDIFKVGVIDDGSRRDGYAQYVCEVLYDEGLILPSNNGHFVKRPVWPQALPG